MFMPVLSDWLSHPQRHEPRASLLQQPFPPRWLPYLDRLPFYATLDARGRARLRDDLRVLVAEKKWQGVGLSITDEIRVVIAAQAALLVLNIEHDYYPGVTTIVVHPTHWLGESCLDRRRERDGAQLDGAAPPGSVLLAWDEVLRGAIDAHDGRNLVLHEFAHQLDLEDGVADGIPPLPDRAAHKQWAHVLRAEFLHLCAETGAGHATLLDCYGARSPAEFFAVATECFCERGAELARRHPGLYLLLWRFFGQDPAARG